MDHRVFERQAESALRGGLAEEAEGLIVKARNRGIPLSLVFQAFFLGVRKPATVLVAAECLGKKGQWPKVVVTLCRNKELLEALNGNEVDFRLTLYALTKGHALERLDHVIRTLGVRGIDVPHVCDSLARVGEKETLLAREFGCRGAEIEKTAQVIKTKGAERVRRFRKLVQDKGWKPDASDLSPAMHLFERYQEIFRRVVFGPTFRRGGQLVLKGESIWLVGLAILKRGDAARNLAFKLIEDGADPTQIGQAVVRSLDIKVN